MLIVPHPQGTSPGQEILNVETHEERKVQLCSPRSRQAQQRYNPLPIVDKPRAGLSAQIPFLCICTKGIIEVLVGEDRWCITCDEFGLSLPPPTLLFSPSAVSHRVCGIKRGRT